jgi:Family of unknown function (DUF6445)
MADYTLRIIDRAIPPVVFDAWSDYAHSVEYQTVISPTDGESYRNVGMPPEGMSLARHIERAINHPLIWAMEFLRYGEPGDGAANIHCDVGYPSMASVLYLNTPEELATNPCGTAFFRHKALGIDRLADPSHAAPTHADMRNYDAWDELFVVPAVTNRLIVYRSDLFHSRWPLEPAPGRRVHVAFFETP